MESPVEAIRDLIAAVNRTHLNRGNQNSLEAKLRAAENSLESGNVNAACGQLGAFVNEARAKQDSGALSSIAALIKLAEEIQAAIGCP